jgi:glutamate dehydrogenase/leucine dehydrogenase
MPNETVFERIQANGHEQVLFCYDRASGLKAIIAIHDTTLGPALGGCRMWPYASEEAALADALNLARGMTYKSAVAGQNFGGGKAVIWGDPQIDKSEALFRAFGRFVGTLAGRFYTGTDVGTAKEDFVWAKMESPYFVGLPESEGGSGDSAIITAYGVWRGMKAVAQHLWGDASLRGREIAVQGLGKVGQRVVEHLVAEGAVLTVTDIQLERAEAVAAQYGVRAVSPEAILDVPCEIFSPNALGGVLSAAALERLSCQGIAGSANNQLAAAAVGDELYRRGILYAPDFVINAGGLIQVADELHGYNRERAYAKTAQIEGTLGSIFQTSRERGIPTHQAAERLAEERIRVLGQVRRTYMSN